MTEPLIKLLTLWSVDHDKSNWFGNPDFAVISEGIWETNGVEVTDKGRIYDMVCRMPVRNTEKHGDIIKMIDWMIIEFCHEVKIVSQPKLESMIKK